MMTKKDFQIIANALAKIEDEPTRKYICDRFRTAFWECNPRFDGDRFEEWVSRRAEGISTKGLG